MSRPLVFLFSTLATLAGLALADQIPSELVWEERLLRESGIGVEPRDLIAFLRRLGMSDRDRVAALIRQLGDDDFERREQAVRDLAHLGAAAFKQLEAAQRSDDPEIAERARVCLEQLPPGIGYDLPLLAARRLVRVAPQHAIDEVLAFLPVADDPDLELELAMLLAEVGVGIDKHGKVAPALAAARSDTHPARRLAAAAALARGDASAQTLAHKLLADSDPQVRLTAARGLLDSGDKSAVPALIALLADAPPRQVHAAEEILFTLAGTKAPVAASARPHDTIARTKAVEAWKTWWATHGSAIDLAMLKNVALPLGVSAVCELTSAQCRAGRAYVADLRGKILWSVEDCGGPIDVHLLTGNRLLLAEHDGRRITERDRQGRILWKYETPESPVACQRLSNGNTLVATYHAIVEVTREGRSLFEYKSDERIYHAQRLSNGNTLLVHAGGQIVEVLPSGRPARSIAAGDTSNWASVELLQSGRLLVCRCSAHQVVELDAAGKVVWKADVPWPTWASRLKNGNTLVASANSGLLVELDRQGKTAWSKEDKESRPCRFRRY